MTKRVLWFSSLLMMGVTTPLHAQSGQEGGLVYLPGEVVVSFQNQTPTAIESKNGVFTSPWESVRVLISDPDLIDVVPLFTQNSPLKNVFLFKFRSDVDIDIKIEAIRREPRVKQAERNFLFEVDVIPNDFYFNTDFNGLGELDRWTLYKMQANRAWDIVKGNASVIIGIVDTGLDFEHPDLDSNVWINSDEDINGNGSFENYDSSLGGDLNFRDDDDNHLIDDVVGWDWFQGDNIPQHDTTQVGSHGSVVGSIVSSETNNNYGIAGVTWHSKIMALKAGEASNINPAYAVQAINYAIEKGAQIINMSFSSYSDIGPLHDVIKAGDSLGVIFVGSAGDHNNELPRYPGSYEEVIRVAVVDSSDHKTVGSSYANDVFISAPSAPTGSAGHGIVICAYGSWDSLYPGDQPPHHFLYTELATSGGAAEVSGALAMLKSAYPSASAAFIKNELARGAEQLPDNESLREKLGAGRVNIFRSLTQWGTIASDTTWSGEVFISGDITIAQGVTLTVNSGTNIYIWGDDNEFTGIDTTRIELWVDGYLKANGTQTEPIKFIRWAGDRTVESTDSLGWWGIFVRDTTGSGAEFNYCIIKNAIRGIQSNKDITIKNSIIERCGYIGVSVAYADSIHIEDTTIRQIGSLVPGGNVGLNLLGGTKARLSFSRIEDVDGAGVEVYSKGKLYADSTQILGNDKGVYVYRGDSLTALAELDSCTFKGNDTGIWVDGIWNGVSIRNCSIEDNTTNGIYCLNNGNALVRGSTIKGNSNGVFSYGSSPKIKRGNMIRDNGVGVKCDSYSQAVVESTTVIYNGVGVSAYNGSEPDIGRGGYSNGRNIIHHNSSHHVVNLTPTITVMAEKNWWNSTKGPKASKIIGIVDYDPWLMSPPSLAPPVVPGKEDATTKSPHDFALSSSYPNPFNPVTNIRYQVPEPGSVVRIVIYNVKGRRVKTILNGYKAPGYYSVVWDGTNDRGQGVSSGIYFVQMRARGFRASRKVLLLK